MTIESIRSSNSKNLTSEKIRYLSNIGFSEETYEYKEKQVRLLVDAEKDKFDFVGEFRDYKVLEVTGDYFQIESYDYIFEKNTVKKLFRRGDCFYEYISHYEFKNYYCRVSDAEL